jgi:UDP-2,3-diacylglucosamine hydrolase
MSRTLFVSDLHLDPAWPDITGLFLEFLGNDATAAQALFILGDLFEAWVGDDDLTEHNRQVIAGLRALTDSGVPVALMHGNRDFLLGAEFATASGCRLIEDPRLIELYGTPTLLMHGDSLCTDDVAYQQFRAQTRDPAWQRAALARPLAERRALAQQMRGESEAHKRVQADDLMDVNPIEVERTLRHHGAVRLIHGHTHRPGRHRFELDGRPVERIVLGDWQPGHGSVLECTASGCQLRELSPAA